MSDLPWTPRGLKFLACVQAVGAVAVFLAVVALGTGLIAFGCLQVYQRSVIATGGSRSSIST